MAKGPTREALLQMLEDANEQLANVREERDNAQSALEAAHRQLSEFDGRVTALEDRADDMDVLRDNRIAANQSLGIYHAFMAGQLPTSSQSLLLMHLIATNPKEFLGAARRAGLGNFLLNLTSDLEEQVLLELRNERKIAAIKLYREVAKVGLKEAKEAVEAIGARNGIPRPQSLHRL